MLVRAVSCSFRDEGSEKDDALFLNEGMHVLQFQSLRTRSGGIWPLSGGPGGGQSGLNRDSTQEKKTFANRRGGVGRVAGLWNGGEASRFSQDFSGFWKTSNMKHHWHGYVSGPTSCWRDGGCRRRISFSHVTSRLGRLPDQQGPRERPVWMSEKYGAVGG